MTAAPAPTRRLMLTATTLGVVAILTFGLAAPPEHCPEPSAEELHQAADDAVQWFVRNQQPDGRWLYEYDAARQVAPDDYNLVRHAGGIMGLYQAATAGIDGALESADRGLEWARGNLVEHDGWTALASGGRAPVGGAALLAAGLAERRLLTGDTTDDELLRGLGRFMVSQTLADGAVVAQYDAVEMAPEAESRSKYYTGEAYWALARLHLLFPDDGFGAVADRIGNYLATQRDDVEDHWPPIPDHWVAYGLSETVTFPERDDAEPLTAAELAYARRQAGLFGSQVRWVSQQAGPWGSVVRGTQGAARRRVRRRRRGADRAVADGRGRRPPGRRPRPTGGAGHLHRRPRGRGAGPGGPIRSAHRRRLVHRRRHADGRPAARHLGAAADRRHRRGPDGPRPRRPVRMAVGHSPSSPPATRSSSGAPCPAASGAPTGRRSPPSVGRSGR